MKICPQCNTSVSDEYRFCLNCGTVLETSSNARAEPLPTLVYQGPVAAQDTVPPTVASDAPVTTPSAPPRTSKSSLAWLLLAAATVAIVGLIVTIVLLKKSATTETAAQNGPAPTPTIASSEIASIPNTNDATPVSSASPTATKQTPTPTPSPSASIDESKQPSATPTPGVVIITPTPTATPTPTPTPASAVDPNRIYSNREISERARIVSQPKATYTEEGRKNQVTGVVVLRVVLRFDGTVGNISVVSGLPDGLTEQAIAAARQIRFTPAQKDGVPVSIAQQVQYVFNLY